MEQRKYLIEGELAIAKNQLRQLNAGEEKGEKRFEPKFSNL